MFHLPTSFRETLFRMEFTKQNVVQLIVFCKLEFFKNRIIYGEMNGTYLTQYFYDFVNEKNDREIRE